MSREEKDRLLRMAKRPRKGPFNAVMDPSEYQAGHGVVELSGAVKESGGYDPWNMNVDVEGEEKEDLPKVKKVKVKVSRTGLCEANS
jgi:nucleolar protein 53